VHNLETEQSSGRNLKSIELSPRFVSPRFRLNFHSETVEKTVSVIEERSHEDDEELQLDKKDWGVKRDRTLTFGKKVEEEPTDSEQ